MCPNRRLDDLPARVAARPALAAVPRRSLNEPTANIRQLIAPIEALRARGIDAGPLLRRIGLSAPLVCEEGARIGQGALCDFWDACAEASGDPAFGLYIGLGYLEREAPAIPPVLAHLARHSATLREAIEHLVRYERLCEEGRRGELIVEPDRAIWMWRTMHGARFSRPFSEHVLAYLARPDSWGAREPTEYDLLEVHFPLAEPPNRALYDSVFKVPLRFDCGHQALVFSRRSLEARNHRADASLAPLLCRLAEDDLGRVPSIARFADRVRAHLAESSGENLLSLGRLARQLGTGERTLRRRLAEENTSYYELVDEWRRGRALQLVRDRAYNLTEVAFLLGYAEQNSFSRAYRRWFGASPAEDRRRAPDHGALREVGHLKAR